MITPAAELSRRRSSTSQRSGTDGPGPMRARPDGRSHGPRPDGDDERRKAARFQGHHAAS